MLFDPKWEDAGHAASRISRSPVRGLPTDTGTWMFIGFVGVLTLAAWYHILLKDVLAFIMR